MTRPGWDSQFSQTESERAERWRATKASRIAKGLCPLCAKTMRECKCGSAMSVEIRKNDDGSIDEVIANGCAIHLEQMDKNAWYLGIDASDGSHWQFWMGANGNCHVVVRHTEMTPGGDVPR